jgi:PncC family amidohydrolase
MYNFLNMADSLEILIGKSLRESGLWLAVAESCTGGLLGHRITNVPGSSMYFKGGVVSYAYEAKRDILGVSMATLEAKGAVSKETVLEMARGVKKIMKADIGLSVSGIAGPGGGSIEKPVGTTWIGMSTPEGDIAQMHYFQGERIEIKLQAAQATMQLLLDYLSDRSAE